MTFVRPEREKTANRSNNGNHVYHQSVKWLLASVFAVVAVCLSPLMGTNITANAQTPGNSKPTCSSTTTSEPAEEPQSPIGPSTMGFVYDGYFGSRGGFNLYSQTNSFSIVSP